MPERRLRQQRWLWPFIVGLASGLAALLALRVAYYNAVGLQPNMHPGIAFYFSPLIFVLLLVVSLPSEIVLRRLWFIPATGLQTALIGFGFSSALLWWALPGLGLLMLFVNPLTLRWLIARAVPSRALRAPLT